MRSKITWLVVVSFLLLCTCTISKNFWLKLFSFVGLCAIGVGSLETVLDIRDEKKRLEEKVSFLEELGKQREENYDSILATNSEQYGTICSLHTEVETLYVALRTKERAHTVTLQTLEMSDQLCAALKSTRSHLQQLVEGKDEQIALLHESLALSHGTYDRMVGVILDLPGESPIATLQERLLDSKRNALDRLV